MEAPANKPVITAGQRLLMAALIAAIRTAKFESKEFQGMASPRFVAAIHDSLFLTKRICAYVEGERH